MEFANKGGEQYSSYGSDFAFESHNGCDCQIWIQITVIQQERANKSSPNFGCNGVGQTDFRRQRGIRPKGEIVPINNRSGGSFKGPPIGKERRLLQMVYLGRKPVTRVVMVEA